MTLYCGRHDDGRAAVDPEPFGAESEARLCERVLGDRRHGLAPVDGGSTGGRVRG